MHGEESRTPHDACDIYYTCQYIEIKNLLTALKSYETSSVLRLLQMKISGRHSLRDARAQISINSKRYANMHKITETCTWAQNAYKNTESHSLKKQTSRESRGRLTSCRCRPKHTHSVALRPIQAIVKAFGEQTATR